MTEIFGFAFRTPEGSGLQYRSREGRVCGVNAPKALHAPIWISGQK